MPQSSPVGTIVSELPSGDARTVMSAVAVGATGIKGPRSWMVIVTSVSLGDIGPEQHHCPPGDVCVTGSNPELDEKARNGPCPPLIVRVVGLARVGDGSVRLTPSRCS